LGKENRRHSIASSFPPLKRGKCNLIDYYFSRGSKWIVRELRPVRLTARFSPFNEPWLASLNCWKTNRTILRVPPLLAAGQFTGMAVKRLRFWAPIMEDCMRTTGQESKDFFYFLFFLKKKQTTLREPWLLRLSDPDSQQFIVQIANNLNNKCQKVFMEPTHLSRWAGIRKLVWISRPHINSFIFTVWISSISKNKIVDDYYQRLLCKMKIGKGY